MAWFFPEVNLYYKTKEYSGTCTVTLETGRFVQVAAQ